MEIRPAVSNDIEALCSLLTEFFTYNAALQPAYYKAHNESGEYPTKSIIESENSDFLVAVENDAILGFIHIIQMETPSYCSLVPHKYAEIELFMVTALHRKQGVGSKLIDAAKQWSKDRNLDYIELFSLSNAESANNFYNNNNFATVSYIRRYTL